MNTNQPVISFDFKWSIILLLFLFFTISFNANAQIGLPCIVGTENSCQCSTAEVLCNFADLDGYTYSMSTFSHPDDGPDPMCSGPQGNFTTSHNPTWFGFIAWCTELDLRVTYTNCTNEGNIFNPCAGIQAAVYDDCSLNPNSAIACNTTGGGGLCDADGQRDLSLSGMTVGNTYYFLVDGCCGSACDILIEILADCGVGDISPWNQEMLGPEEVCLPDGESTYSITRIMGGDEYYWYVDGVFTAYDNPQTLEVTWTTPGIHTICVDVDKQPCIDESDFPPQLCKTICVLPSSADAGSITATPSPTCPDDDITIQASGYNNIPEFTEYIFVTDDSGSIIYTEPGDSGTFIPDACGTYIAYSYNFKDNDTFDPPMIGQIIADIADCDTTCFCAMEPINFIIEDTELPVFTAPPGNLDIDCFDGLAAMEDLNWTDNCAGSGAAEGVEVGSATLCDGGNYTRTWTYTDQCDNEATHVQTITVSAVPVPVFDMEPADLTVECLADLMPGVNLDFTNSSVGSCLIDGNIPAVESGTPTACGGTLTYTWSFTDLCGRLLEHEQDITVEMIDPPVYVDPLGDITYDCIDEVPAAIDLVWNSNCGGTGTTEAVEMDNTDACLGGTIIRTWNYVDPCGQPASHMQTITINPVPQVVWTSVLPTDINVVCGETFPPFVDLNYSNSALGACLDSGMESPVEAGTHDVCGDIVTRTWSYTPDCGTPITYVQNITLIDTEDPVFTDPPGPITFTCISEVPDAPNLVWTDNCDGTGDVPAGEVDATDACLGGTITRNWIYTDDCGNPVTHMQVITIDPIPDVVWTSMLPPDVTITCDDALPTLNMLDYSNGAPEVDCLDEGSVPGMEVGMLDVCGDIITRTWMYTPTCGPAITHTQTIELEDTEDPTWPGAPGDISYDCISEVPAMTDQSWDDNCDGTGMVEGVEDDMTSGCAGGTIIRTWSYTDECGNPSTHMQTITVNPIPVVVWTTTLPGDEEITCNESIPALIELEFSNGSSIVSCLDEGMVPAVEVGTLEICGDQIIRNWEYLTICGETITHMQTITLIDTDDPVFTDPPMDETYDCVLDVPVATDLTWTDICDGTGEVPVVEVDMTDACTGGTITRTWEYTDACGNTATHPQVITVNPVPDVVWITTLPIDVTIQCGDDVPMAIDLNYSNSSPSTNCLDEGTIPPVEIGELLICDDMITRTWEYTPTCGPALTHTQTITLEDMIDPVFVDPPGDETYDCVADVTPEIDLTWTDNCDGTGVVEPTIDGTLDDCTGGTITRTWEYTDNCGNTVTHPQVITVNPVPDVIWITTLPIDVTIQCGDDIPDAIDLDYSNSSPSTNCLDEGTIPPVEVGELLICDDMITRTWEYTPTCGPVLTHTQTITLEDMIDPVFVDPPGDETYDCVADVIPEVDLTWTDNCDGTGVVEPTIDGTLDDCTGGTITRTWEYTDNCGNTVTHPQVITVNPVPDVIWITTLPIDITIQCGDDIPDAIDLDYSNSSPSTNCLDEGTIPPVEEGELLICEDMITRTWEYTPTCGPVLTHTQTITLQDLINPVFVDPPGDEVYDCVADVTASTDLTWTDNCDGTGVVEPTLDGTLDACSGGTATRTWEYIDDCGNPVTHIQTVIVNPVPDVVWINTPPADVTIQCGDNVPMAIDLDYSNGASASCVDEGTIPPVEEGELLVCNDMITRTWEYTPTCGPALLHVQTITLEDMIPPVFVDPPASETYDCIGDVIAESDLTWTDNCDGTGEVSPTIDGTIDDCTGGTAIRTWEYIDECGNPVTHMQTVIVNPVPDVVWTTAPPADVILQCGDDIPDAIDLNYSNSAASPTCLDEGVLPPVEDGTLTVCGDMITRTWEYTPTCGPALLHVQTITLEDLIPPVFVGAPTNETFDCLADVPTAIDLTWTDNCDGTGMVPPSISDTSDPCTGGSITRSWEYTDECGNPVTAMQLITINPVPDVMWTTALPPDVILQCGDAIPDAIDLNYSNGLSGVVCAENGIIPPVEVGMIVTCGDMITRTWEFTPTCGPAITHTQTITLEDTEPPVLVDPLGNASYNCLADVPAAEDLTWTDNCDGTGTVPVSESGTLDGCTGGILTRTWEYTDECGNTTPHIQTITVDPVPDVVWTSSLPADQNLNCGDDIPTLVDLNYSNSSLSASCLDQGISEPIEVGTLVSCGDMITRTWEYTPACGPALSHTQTITLVDTEAPVFTFEPANESYDCFGDVTDAVDLTWTDNCDGTGTVEPTIINDFTNCDGGTITRTWDFTDACGNPVTYSQFINIGSVPNVNWVSSLPTNITINCGDPVPDLIDLEYSNNAIGDLCLDTGFSEPTESGTLVTCGDQITREWLVAPACGPQIMHQQIITLDDIEDPVFINVPMQTLNISCIEDLPVNSDLTWTDNCDGTGTVPFTLVSGQLNECEGGTVTRVWEYTDNCGNGPVSFFQIINLGKPDSMPCDDDDDCTINDVEVVSCSGFICEPCAGVPTDCSGDTEAITCDDENDCTVNDVQMVACNGEICVPCQGTPATCDDGIVFVEPCNDIDPCTINDVRTVDCQGDICIPCAGTPNPTDDPILPAIPNTCQGQQATITVTGCETGINTWYSDPAGTMIVFIGSTFQTPILNADATYYVDCTVDDCQSELVEVFVPVVPAEMVIIEGDDFICEYETTVLSTNLPGNPHVWSNGDLTQVIVENNEGVYVVTVTDSNGCTSTDDFILTVAFDPIIQIAGSTTFCTNSTTLLTAPSGFDLYAWEPNFENTESITVNSAGTYIVTVTDSNGCTGSSSVDVTEADVLNPNISGGDNFCVGGFVELSIGSGFSNIEWQPGGENTESITVDEPGVYTVTVQDGTCAGMASITVVENALPTPIIDAPAGICPNELASLNASNPDYSNYIWSTGSVNGSILTGTPGDYSVTVTDLNGCTASTTVTMDFLAPPLAEITGDNKICPDPGSSIALSANTGTNLSYEWSTGDMTNTITVTGAGTYILTVTDNNNCSTTATAIIGNHISPDVIISGSQSFCTDGSTTIDAGDFASYVWAPNGEMTRTIDVNSEGTYSVTITDENGCTGSSSTAILELTELLPVIGGPSQVCPGENSTLFIGGNFETYAWSTGEMGVNTITVPPGMSYSVTVSDASGCTGSSTVMVSNYNVTQVTIDGDSEFCAGELSELTALSGFAEYEWSNGSAGQMITINEAQTYTVTATDSNGCTSEASTVVSQIDNPTPSILGVSELCADGQTTLSTELFSSYEWSNGSMDQTTVVNVGGAISVTVTDANGCIGSTSIIVTEFNLPNVTITGSPSFCLGGFTTLGTLDEYELYNWSPGGEITQTIIADTEGTYTVTVTDMNGCTASTSINTSLETSLSPTINGTTLLCSGQTETLTVGAFDTYEWSTGAMTQSIDISTSDTYAVTVYDASGCSGETSVDVTVVNPTQVSILGSDKLCEGGNASFSAIGGTFTNYEWSTGFNTSGITIDAAGNYAVTVTDTNGCTSSSSINVTVANLPTPEIGGDPNFCIDGETELNLTQSFSAYDWSTGSMDATITVNTTGLYTVTVTDINGCQASSSLNVFTYPEVNPTIGGSTTYCPGGNTTLDAGSEYTAWEWSTGEMTQTIQFAMETTVSVTVTDINGCTGMTSTPITEEPSLSPSILGNLIICEGQSTVLDAGAAFDTWLWSTGEMTQTIEVTEAGIYSVFVTQGTCSGSGEVEVIVNALPTPTIDGPENICVGDIGTLTVIGTYNVYSWSTNSNLESIIVSDPGIYMVTVTDGNGCTNSTSFEVLEVPLPTPEILGDPNFCPDANTTLSLSESYTTYEWSTGSPNATIDVAMTGQYTVTVTDANGCSGNSAINVFMYPEVNPNIGGSTTYCPGGNTTLDGGSQYVAWEWSTGEMTQTIQYAQETLVTLQVTDMNGCTGTSAIMVTEEPSLSPAILGDLDICEGETTILDGGAAFDTWMWSTGEMTQTIEVDESGVYTLFVTQGTCSGTGEVEVVVNPIPTPIIDGVETICVDALSSLSVTENFEMYNWSTGANLQSIFISDPGIYTVTVTDVNGCTSSSSLEVMEVPLPTPEISGDPNFCLDGSTELGLSETFEVYAWSTGSDQATINVSTIGQYMVTVTDINGCEGSASINVFQYPDVDPTIGGSTSFCPGGTTTLDGGSQYVAWEWSTGEVTQTIQFDQETLVSLEVTDINGCTGSSSVMITEEDSLSPSIIGDLEICENETTILDGGAAFDTWLWSTGEMTQTIEVNTSGVYTLEVTQGTCSGVGEVTVIVNPLPEPIVDGPENICFGEDAILTCVDNFPVYQWSTGDITKSVNISNPGSFTLIVTDDNGCTAATSFTVIAKPTPTIENIIAVCGEDKDTYDVTFSTTADEVSCATYPVEALGGIDYAVNEIDTNDVIQIYLLDTESMCDTTLTIMKPNCSCGAVADAGPNAELNCVVLDVTLGGINTSVGPAFTYEWTDASGTIVSTDMEYNATSEGTYTLEVFDADFDCSVEQSVTVDNIISDPSADIFPDPGLIIDCEIGIVTLTSANEANVSYTWTTSTTIIEALSINIETGTTVVLLATDTITFCSNIDSILITDNELYPLINIDDPEEITCIIDSVLLDATGSQNSPDITYNWSDESGTSLGNAEQLTVDASGWYYLVLEDVVNGCINDDSVFVSENLEAPTVVTAEDILLPCDETTVSISATVQGNADILWSTNTGAISSDADQLEATVTSIGMYYFTATNPATGCFAIDSIEVISNDDKVSEVDLDLRQPMCFGDETGDLTITILAGGTPPFQYEIESLNLSNDNGVFNNLLPGAYDVLITDALGCLYLAPFEITDVEEVTFESPTANIEIDYGNDTTLVLETNLDLDEIETITWSPDIEGSCNTCLEIDVDNATQGQTYLVTLLDIYGCEVTTTIRLNVNIVVDIHVPNIINPNSSTGNSKFFPQTDLDALEVIEFYVYDRWGELVYTAKNFPVNDPSFGWDGKFKGQNVVPGVYVYYMNVAIPGLENQSLAGDITVIY